MGSHRKILVVILVAALLLAATICSSPQTSTAEHTLGSSDPLLVSVASSASTEATTVPTTLPPTETTAPEPTYLEISGITAEHAFLFDCASGEYLYINCDPHEIFYPASVTKLFTAYVALQYLDPAQVVTVGDILDTLPWDSSTALLSKGDRLTVTDLIYAMLLPSGGDAARVTAVAAGKVIAQDDSLSQTEAYDAFVEEMNRMAAQCGMTDSHFANPDGYPDDAHYTSVADVLCIAQLAMGTPLIRQVVGTSSYTATLLNNGKELLWPNSNLLLRDTRPEFHCDAAVGMKTGYTSKAGYCLVSAFLVDGEYVLAGVFGCETSEQRYVDTLAMFHAI